MNHQIRCNFYTDVSGVENKIVKKKKERKKSHAWHLHGERILDAYTFGVFQRGERSKQWVTSITAVSRPDL